MEQNCLALNNVIAYKDEARKTLYQQFTGSAKTENTITYCAMLPKTTVLISTNLTDEADRLADDINNEANDNRACSYHSKKRLKIDDASKYQIVILTYLFIKKFYGIKKWKTIAKDRELIIDEALNTMQELSLTTSEINIALTCLHTTCTKMLRIHGLSQSCCYSTTIIILMILHKIFLREQI